MDKPNFQAGIKVLDSKTNEDAQVELVHPAGFIVLDKSFGPSTFSPNRELYIQEHGSDGRYSISYEQAVERLTLITE